MRRALRYIFRGLIGAVALVGVLGALLGYFGWKHDNIAHELPESKAFIMRRSGDAAAPHRRASDAPGRNTPRGPIVPRSGKPTQAFEDKVYEIEDELRLAGQT